MTARRKYGIIFVFLFSLSRRSLCPMRQLPQGTRYSTKYLGPITAMYGVQGLFAWLSGIQA